jgi:pimeloyl-ACP methyl ester carboxylesterase
LGEGTPAVILEHGGYGWILAQTGISKFTETCWYDRAGQSWSDPPPAPRTSQFIANDLHELLEKAKIPPPYVLVGHSIGGEYVRIYTAKFPSEVAGLVLVDSSHPDQREPSVLLSPVNRMSIFQRRLVCAISRPTTRFLARFGVLRLILRSTGPAAPEQLSPEQQRIYRASRMQPESVAADVAQGCASTDNGAIPFDKGTGDPEVDAAARASGTLGDRPLIVLTAGKYWIPPDPVAAREMTAFHEVWVHQLQASLARLSTRGRQIVVQESDHGMPLEAPQAIVGAVQEVVAQVRKNQ